jgi:low molecular weight phosphotyrosine protein phosphatase
MAEAVFKEVSKSSSLSLTVDSCGTASYHVGELPDSRVVKECKRHGVTVAHRARQLRMEDFDLFDYILGMDHENLENINLIKPSDSKTKVMLFGEFGSDDINLVIKDPYYGGSNGFSRNYEQILDCSYGLLRELEK